MMLEHYLPRRTMHRTTLGAIQAPMQAAAN